MKRRNRRMILHVGQTKAGSTAIQNYLDNQRDALRAAGILFPKTFLLRRNPIDPERTPGHFGLIKALGQGGDMRPFLDECAQANCTTLVLSIEGLFQDQPDETLAAIGAFGRDWLAGSGEQLELVAVVRSFPDWLASRYNEEVLTGYQRREMLLTDFAQELVAQGAHDYAARLRHLTRILGAGRTVAINYDAASDGGRLLPVFLNTVNLPVTAPEMARDLKANVRQKDWFLVESTRRQNHALHFIWSKLTGLTRRRLEAAVRAEAQTIARRLTAPPSILAGPSVPLDAAACRQIAQSNLLLVRNYFLSPPLPDPDPDTEPVTHSTAGRALSRQHRQDWPGIEALTVFGLITAVDLCREAAAIKASDSASQSFSLLTEPGIDLTITALAKSRVSLHLDSPETALWAACLNGKLPILLSDRHPVPESARLLSLKLPSDVICLDGNVSPKPILRKRRVDLVVVPPGVSAAWVQEVWKLAGSGAKVIMMNPNPDIAETVANGLGLVCTDVAGRIRVLDLPGKLRTQEG